MTTLGAVFLPYGPPAPYRDVVRAADESGVEELWLWEDCFRQGGIASLAAALAWSQRLRVGIGVLPVPLRNVALTAMEVAALELMFPGRAVLGIGHGVGDWMGQVGVRPGSPMTLMREYATALRALLHGERVTTGGRYVKLDGVALDWPPATAPAVHMAATGPKTLRLAGEVADGTVLSGGSTPGDVKRARELADAGRADAGRPTRPHTITVYVTAVTGSDTAALLEADRRYWKIDDDAAHGVGGDAAAIAAEVAAYAEAGADTVVLQPTVGEPDPAGFVRFIGEQVRPLVPGSRR